jgi:hypothetical protein
MMSISPITLLITFVAAAGKSSCQQQNREYRDINDRVLLGERRLIDCSGFDPALYGGLVGTTFFLGIGLGMFLHGNQPMPQPKSSSLTVVPWTSGTAGGLEVLRRF